MMMMILNDNGAVAEHLILAKGMQAFASLLAVVPSASGRLVPALRPSQRGCPARASLLHQTHFRLQQGNAHAGHGEAQGAASCGERADNEGRAGDDIASARGLDWCIG